MISMRETVIAQDRYDDGFNADYKSIIRVWNAIDKSVAAFNRRCGVAANESPEDRAALRRSPIVNSKKEIK